MNLIIFSIKHSSTSVYWFNDPLIAMRQLPTMEFVYSIPNNNLKILLHQNFLI